VPIRHAEAPDLAAVVAIYNASIPGRLATADTEPVTVAARRAWFAEFDPACRPLWVHTGVGGAVDGWLSLRSFYGRPAYRATVETGVYVAPQAQRRGVGRSLLAHALAEAPRLGIRTLLAFAFSHNGASIALFSHAGFVEWGRLPGVAELDGVERDLSILGRRL
jgi:phosphinothricin acetyltransferase